jgi:putative transport protein
MPPLFSEPLFVIFATLALGCWIGQYSIRGVSLGAAGVLFAGLALGHLGLQAPTEIMNLGQVLFVYAVGLQAGPRFFRAFRRTGLQFAIIGLLAATAGAVATIVLALVLGLPADLACGLFAGAVSNTPALAAATDAFGRIGPGHGANISVGYGIAYPCAVVGVVLLVQLMRRLGRKEIDADEERWATEQASDHPDLEAKTFRLTNPACDGKTLADLDPQRLSGANITHVRRGDEVTLISPRVVLRRGDFVMATGSPEELEKLRLILGEEIEVAMDLNRDIVSVLVDVTNDAIGAQALQDLQVRRRHGVIVTSIRRQGVELAPTGTARLELGDTIVVVGERAMVEPFAAFVNPHRGKTDETTMLPFLLGLALGVVLGSIPVHLPNGITIKLNAAGGAFVVSLLVGHLGHVRRFRLIIPQAATNFARDLGLLLFLAGTGTVAGSRLVPVLRQHGPRLLLSGALITLVSVGTALLVMRRLYRMRMPQVDGALAAAMTNSAALGTATEGTRSDQPMLAYASTYPVALIVKIILVQLLVEVLGRWW